jgi:uncharacterized FlaG/YvyC family protein
MNRIHRISAAQTHRPPASADLSELQRAPTRSTRAGRQQQPPRTDRDGSRAVPRSDTETSPPASGLGKQALQEIVAQVKDALRESLSVDHDVSLVYLEDGSFVVEVRDPESGDLILQIPPESLVKMRKQLREAVGLLFDRKS